MKTIPIRQSVADWCFLRGKKYEPDVYYRTLKSIGFEGVEMATPDRWPIIRQAGLELVNIGAGGMQTNAFNKLDEHSIIVPKVEEAIATAAQNHIRQVIIFSGNRRGIPDDAAMANCVKGIKAVAGKAERAGVMLVFELLNKFDHTDYQADNGVFAFGVVKAVASPAVKVLYDIYHADRMGENILDSILPNLEWIGHLHLAGSPKRNYPSADQNIDYRKIVSAVHKAGYRGYWGHEFIPASDALEELPRAFRDFQSYVQA